MNPSRRFFGDLRRRRRLRPDDGPGVGAARAVVDARPVGATTGEDMDLERREVAFYYEYK
jgi:hypothetical protein|tara:strand:- start:6660 stop:6839 length:180 start_codon:yes stop_codon:yes gene_type:complete